MTKNQGWLAEVERFFYKGASHSWAGGNEGTSLKNDDLAPEMDEWRQAIYRDMHGFPGFHFADRWGIDPDSGRPSGSMIITHWSIPVWGMWVGGSPYKDDVYPFLREVLQQSYVKHKFCGGRGEAEYRSRDYLYTNVYEGSFARFHGREQIEYIKEDGSLRLAGSHEYWGGSFVYLPPA